MKCPQYCGSETRVADSRTAAKPGFSLPPYIQALLPDNRWWRWRRHHCLDCDAKTSTVEITLEHFEELCRLDSSFLSGSESTIAQLELEMAELLSAIRAFQRLDGSETQEQQETVLDRLGDVLVLHELEP